jgi:hypothetical protein
VRGRSRRSEATDITLESDFSPEREKQVAGLRLIFDDPAIGQLFVLRVDGRVAGMANALVTASIAEGRHVVLLEDVIVAARAAENGLPRITLLVDQNNAAPLAFFYERMGFRRSAMRVLRKAV